MTIVQLKFRPTYDDHRKVGKETLFCLMRRLIHQFRFCGRERTAETYSAALNSFSRFTSGKDIRFEDIDEALLLRYEVYLHSCGVTMNTSSFYMRILRATYNRAVERGLTEQHYPFKLVYTGIDKTIKRAIPLKYIKIIKALNLSDNEGLEFARDMFMFSFYTRGMSLIDMAYLTSDNLCNGRLTYTRHKTGQQLSVRWERCMQEIVDKYHHKGAHYLLPIIRHEGVDERLQYKSRSSWLCNRLKRIGAMIKLDFPLTMYVARHSWASIARTSHIPISIISESMGHESEQTTQIYLSSFDYVEVDKANRRILKML